MIRCLTTVVALLAMNPYQAGIVKWREQKETELKADGGWLTVTGLFWLKEGENRVEGAPGVFVLHDGKARFQADTAARIASRQTPDLKASRIFLCRLLSRWP